MRFEGLDLNLLIALDAILEERSVMAASRRLHLSQPAMSAAVGRLRRYFNDEIFTISRRNRWKSRRGTSCCGFAPI